MHIINSTNYKLCGTNEEYRITTYGSMVAYSLYLIEDNATTFVEQETVPASSEIAIILEQEGKYSLKISYTNHLGETASDTFIIRYFLTVKSRIINWMKSMICDCTKLDNDILNCTNTATTPVAQDLYDAQLLFASTGLYRDYLLSPDFLRSYQCCFTMVLDEERQTLDTLLNSAYDSVVNNGVTPNSTRLMRFYAAYLYILFYVMEMDAAVCGDGNGAVPPPPPPPPDSIPASGEFDHTEEVETLFDTERVSKCMTELGIDFNDLRTQFEDCYLERPVGLCIVVGDVTSPPSPVDASIANLDYIDHILIVETGTTVSPVTFSWEITGTPENLMLNDGGNGTNGTLQNVPVSGTSHNTAETYTFNSYKVVNWMLYGDNVEPISMTTKWVHPIYTGKDSIGGFPNEATILAGTKHITESSIGFSHNPNTTSSEYGWIAVPTNIKKYTNWKVLDGSYNNGEIGVEDEEGWEDKFIAVAKDPVDVGGVNYFVYVYNHASELSDILEVYLVYN